MNPNLPFFVATPRRHRKRKYVFGAPPPVFTLILTEAEYSETELTIMLRFDRVIDVLEIDGSQITVVDGVDNYKSYIATGEVDQINVDAVKIGLVETGDYEGFTVLNASAATGIVAVDDGGAWAGATDLPLNYP